MSAIVVLSVGCVCESVDDVVVFYILSSWTWILAIIRVKVYQPRHGCQRYVMLLHFKHSLVLVKLSS